MQLPESPKFLLAQGKHRETIDCLKFVYKWNNKSCDKFPVSQIQQNFSNKINDLILFYLVYLGDLNNYSSIY